MKAFQVTGAIKDMYIEGKKRIVIGKVGDGVLIYQIYHLEEPDINRD